jgi:membrane protein DedA with SNARE-associated domain
MSLEELVSTYGYTAIAIGTFLEGETILVIGGFSAHRGFLELPWVIVCAFLGSFLGDQTYFYIGRFRGEKFLNKRPHWKAKSTKVLELLQRNQSLLILGSRFLYGIRTVTPFLIGTAKISPVKFFVLDMIGAFAWAAIVGGLGYSFGYAMEAALPDIKRYEKLFFIALAGIGLEFWLFRLLTQKRTRIPLE